MVTELQVESYKFQDIKKLLLGYWLGFDTNFSFAAHTEIHSPTFDCYWLLKIVNRLLVFIVHHKPVRF